MFLPTRSQSNCYITPRSALQIGTAPRTIRQKAQLVITGSRGRLFPKDGTNVTSKMGRSYLGCAHIPCYTRAAWLAYALLPSQLSGGYQQLTPRKSGPGLTAAGQRTEAIGKPNRRAV
jgi:hypothetical protein